MKLSAMVFLISFGGLSNAATAADLRFLCHTTSFNCSTKSNEFFGFAENTESAAKKKALAKCKGHPKTNVNECERNLKCEASLPYVD